MAFEDRTEHQDDLKILALMVRTLAETETSRPSHPQVLHY